MFDIGFGELLVCLIVALLVLGPERLPGAVRTVGRWVGRARHTVSHFTDQIDREIRAEQLKRRIEEEIRKSGVNDIAREVDSALRAPLNLPGPHDTPAPQTRAPDNTPDNTIAPPAIAAAPAVPPVTPEAAAAPAGTGNRPS
ncbi:MAG: Sec-independent protein translocase protein TatB [Pseudomonadota bacterium]